MSARARVNGIKKARPLLPPGTTARDYLAGRANARMTTGALVAISVFTVAFLVALALGTILIPGGLLLIYVVHAIRPPRAIVVADEGLAVFEKSFLNGRPTKLLALVAPAGVVLDPSMGQPVILTAGGDRINLRKGEADRLRAAMGQNVGVLLPA
jgi:hypothetical protein